MKCVVITGSTKGIGYGLAEAFLQRDCYVVISSRDNEDVQEVAQKLAAGYGKERVLGQACDVSNADDVQHLWNGAAGTFGKVDIWINNAGQSTSQRPLWQLDDEEIKSVVAANMLGTMNGSKVAIKEMIRQGFGALYNFLGFGSDGMHRPGMLVYGSTKYGIKYFTDGLKEEVKHTPIIAGSISPGMVATHMLLKDIKGSPKEQEATKRKLNILADKVETVAPWIAEQVLNNKTKGTDIAWLTRSKIIWRFLSSPFHKRHIID